MTNLWIAAGCVALLAACGGNENTSGTPETNTTGTAQSVQQTTPEAATTTGITGGTSSSASPEEKEFVANAGMSGLSEVQLANLALQNAESADVKAFAQRMVADHSKSNAELSQLATAKGLVLPAELAGTHQQGFEHLQGLTGAEFDRAYMQHMVSDHNDALQLFQNGAAQAKDPEIKAFATKTIPILQEHARMAQQVAAGK